MLERLDHVRVAALDPAVAAAEYETLLSTAAHPWPRRDGAWRLEVGGTGLLIVPASSPDPSAAGVEALVFAGDEPGPSLQESRGVRLEVDGECGPRAAASPVDPCGAARLDHAVVLTTDFDAALTLYGERLGLRLALDRSFPRRGVRILFFRIAGVTVEVAGPLDPPEVLASDHFGGLAWRGSNVVAWRERLVREGVTVSEGRVGHKPGTRVCTVSDRTAGVPTLLIGQDEGED